MVRAGTPEGADPMLYVGSDRDALRGRLTPGRHGQLDVIDRDELHHQIPTNVTPTVLSATAGTTATLCAL